MASRTFISWICHFWAQFWLNFNFGDFRAYFGYFSLVKIDFFEIYFQSWRIKLRVLKFFRPILIIKRHQKNTQAKLFEKFASRQHALVDICFINTELKRNSSHIVHNNNNDNKYNTQYTSHAGQARWVEKTTWENRVFGEEASSAIVGVFCLHFLYFWQWHFEGYISDMQVRKLRWV